MGKNPPKWLAGERVNETILVQRKSVEELRADKVLRKDKVREMKMKHKSKIDAKRKRKLNTKKFISAQTILKYAQREHHQARKFHKIGEKVENRQKILGPVRMAKQFKASGIALLVRSKGNLIPKDVAAAFKELGLNKIYSARLLHLGPHNYTLMKQLKPFSLVGYPQDDQVEKLIRTRGCLWNEETQSKRFISGNRLIEDAFGQYNILCVEDLTASITGKVDDVDRILKQLAPFDFHPPRQLFVERHRSAHQKLEVINPESFASYIGEQLGDTMREEARENKRKAKVAVAQSRTLEAAAKMVAKKVEKNSKAAAHNAPKVAAAAAATSPASAKKTKRADAAEASPTGSARKAAASPAKKKARSA